MTMYDNQCGAASNSNVRISHRRRICCSWGGFALADLVVAETVYVLDSRSAARFAEMFGFTRRLTDTGSDQQAAALTFVLVDETEGGL
jgi:hypothetical protein